MSNNSIFNEVEESWGVGYQQKAFLLPRGDIDLRKKFENKRIKRPRK